MIAEEAARLLPQIVEYEQGGVNANGMDYSKLTPLWVEAVKTLKTEFDQQLAEKEREIAAQGLQLQVMQTQLEELRTTVDRLALLK
jgi:archaellum component FlaC